MLVCYIILLKKKQAFCIANHMVSDYFHLGLIPDEDTKSGKALASLVTPSSTPLN